MTTQVICDACTGAGRHFYDLNHIQPCESCCRHSEGWWKLDEHYGKDNGKFACKSGCGTIIDDLPNEEDSLMEMTRGALADILGREPTQQEVLRAHAGFKRMAFHLYEHMKREKDG